MTEIAKVTNINYSIMLDKIISNGTGVFVCCCACGHSYWYGFPSRGHLIMPQTLGESIMTGDGPKAA